MKPSQILAIDRVGMEAHPSSRERLIWFYRDLVGLTFVEGPLNPGVLRFRSGLLELRIRLVENPVVEAIRRRAVISVRSLDEVTEALEAQGLSYPRLSGLIWADQRVGLLDAGGNRVELKQEWRRGMFPGPAAQRRDQQQRSGPGPIEQNS